MVEMDPEDRKDLIIAFCDELAGAKVQKSPDRRMAALIGLQQRFDLTGWQGRSVVQYLDRVARRTVHGEVMVIDTDDEEDEEYVRGACLS